MVNAAAMARPMYPSIGYTKLTSATNPTLDIRNAAIKEMTIMILYLPEYGSVKRDRNGYISPMTELKISRIIIIEYIVPSHGAMFSAMAIAGSGTEFASGMMERTPTLTRSISSMMINPP